jgi:epoxyqueuosine reductase
MDNIKEIINQAGEFIANTDYNKIKELKGIQMFDAPIIGIAAADDPLFLKLKDKEAIGDGHMTPLEWMPQAKAVISYFLPFTEAVRKANRENKDLPAIEWLYGRIEGEIANKELAKFLVKKVADMGGEAIIPSLDSRFVSGNYKSNWSERHVAFISGLGTFGLSKSIITEKGAAGRLGSLIVSIPFEATERKYEGVYDYCSQCGACINRCPAQAIDKLGKKHEPCEDFLTNVTKKRFAPRYGCGKCQTAVPCEYRIPVVRKEGHKE